MKALLYIQGTFFIHDMLIHCTVLYVRLSVGVSYGEYGNQVRHKNRDIENACRTYETMVEQALK